MPIKSYIRGFTAYPVDTRQMTTSMNEVLSAATTFAAQASNGSVTLALSNTKIEWSYFGGQVFMVVFYQVLNETPNS